VSTETLPAAKLRIIDSEQANDEILAFAAGLIAEGKRPWFEVRYPTPAGRDDAEWQAEQEKVFDAVEVIDGVIVTLPPYAELQAAGR
jgi:hypothetical protein